MPDQPAEPKRTRSAVFITGATGFIGRRVMAALTAAADRPLRCLVRESQILTAGPTVSVVRGELNRPESYMSALEGIRTVLHLAARTGKAPRALHFQANLDGTAALLNASRRAGVERFVNVSSIATTYQHRTAYHYADSKLQAEQLVRSSGLHFVNVRPTLVLGSGSPVGRGLLKIATLPLVPLFGDGSVRVQPIHVDDVADFLVSALDEPRLDSHDIDLGGPDIVSMRELLTRIRRAANRGEARFVRLPGLATMRAIAVVEPALGGLLPLSAGQLSAFVNHSTAKATVPGLALQPRCTLDEMIRETVAHG